MRNKKMLFYEYLANAETYPKLISLLKENGYSAAKSDKELTKQLIHFVKNRGDEGLKLIAALHPDRELIIWSEVKNNAVGDTDSKDLGERSILHANDENQLSATGENNDYKEKMLNNLIIAGGVVLGLTLVVIGINTIKS